MPCTNNRPCTCPKTTCKNHGLCCACIPKHRETDSLPHCLFPDNEGDKSLANFHRHLTKKFNPKK